ncbi:hypothetical protein ACWCV2_17255 [Streptomyces pseudogriseolus]
MPYPIVRQVQAAELPGRLPLEGWSSMTLHCQVDAIGPSDRHPDLVKLELSIPPAARVLPGINCGNCGPTSTEQHPRRPGVLRCANCKEHLGPVPNFGEIGKSR